MSKIDHQSPDRITYLRHEAIISNRIEVLYMSGFV